MHGTTMKAYLLLRGQFQKYWTHAVARRGQLKCDGTHAETRFRLSAKRDESIYIGRGEGGSVQSTADSRGVRISGSNAGYTMFRGSVKGTG